MTDAHYVYMINFGDLFYYGYAKNVQKRMIVHHAAILKVAKNRVTNPLKMLKRNTTKNV